MSFVTLLHNPGAGLSTLTRSDLISIIESNGYQCRYEGAHANALELFDPEAEFIIVAGGDGTVRKVIRQVLVHQAAGRTWPIAILPVGTANNIAHTLCLEGSVEELVAGWKSGTLRKYDVAGITGTDQGSFLLEGFGFGLFPHVMRRMSVLEKEARSSHKLMLNTALQLMHRRLPDYEEKTCFVEVDEKDYSGKYFMVEVMNSSFIGPNLLLSLHSDPGDGKLEVVLLSEKNKVRFGQYLYRRINGAEADFPFHALKGSRIRLGWSGRLAHLDDAFFKQEKNKSVSIQALPGVLEFIVPGDGEHSLSPDH